MQIRRWRRPVLQALFLLFAGWFGEWSYLVSLARSIPVILRGGGEFAVPRIADFTWNYGVTWRVGFYVFIGSPVSLSDIGLNALALLLIVPLVWIAYEIFKFQAGRVVPK